MYLQGPGGGEPLVNTQTIRQGLQSASLSPERLVFLAKLPQFLNSSLETPRIIHIALEHIRGMLQVEQAAVYLADDRKMRFWSHSEGEESRVEGTIDYPKQGLVASVIESNFPLFIRDVEADPRLASSILGDDCQGVTTAIGVPLTDKHKQCIGAVVMMNRVDGSTFESDDVGFVSQFGHQVALALDHARMYEELKQRTEELEQIDRRKNELIQIISHEFRTPLSVIHNSAELVAEMSGNAEAGAEIVTLLQSGVERLTKLVSDIKNLSLVQNEDLPLNRKPVVVQNLFADLEQKFQPIAAERSLSLTFDGGEKVAAVNADPVMLMLVIQHLITNAIRWTDDGGTIMVSAAIDDSDVVFQVCDTGVGLKETDVPLIFNKFYEVTHVMEHTSGDYSFKACGLGLGLATVRHILRTHGSNIAVTSKLGEGSCFSFKLPCA